MPENEASGPRSKTTARTKAAEAVTVPSRRNITPEERHRQIAEAAYFRAEQRGFRGRDPAEDWYEAEVEIDAALARDEAKERHRGSPR
jgi:hypothetical protein